LLTTGSHAPTINNNDNYNYNYDYYSQRAVTPCRWGEKALGMVCVWVAGKTV